MADRMSARFFLFFFLSSSILLGCDKFDPKVPTEKLLVDTLVGYSKKHGGVYEFQNIKKLDGQLQSDGLHYIMEYQAILKTNSCFNLPLDENDWSYEGFIDFGKSINKNLTSYHCSAGKVLAFQNSGVYFISGLQSPFHATAVFTKKESGWQIKVSGVSWKRLGGR